jgi:plastocyanin
MHSLAIQLAPVVAAKSKVPFYFAGGALVLWALIVSLLLGLRNPKFPGNLQGERAVIAITAVLVLAAVSTAVLTSEPDNSAAAGGKPPEPSIPQGAPTPGAPETPPPSAAAAPATTGTSSAPAPSASSTTSKTGAATQLALAANTSGLLSYNTKQLAAKAGNVTITMANMSPLEHNVTISQGRTVLGATPTFVGGSKSVTLKLTPGTYTFYCSVPGHRQAGMEGTLKVS